MLVFQYEDTPSKVYSYVISDVLANIWNTLTWDYGSPWMLVDNDAGYFYIIGGSLGDSYKIHKRSIVDGSLIALSDTVYVGPFYLCQVDSNGDIWCYNEHGNFYKLDASTLAITTYTLKSDWDSDGDGDQQYACMTFDGLYFYVTGYTGSRVAKFSVANLDGGDPEWYVDLGDLQAFRIFTDSNGDVYVANQNYSSPYYISIRKLSGVDGSLLWGPINTGSMYGGFLCYHEEHHSIYVPCGINTVRQIDADTGLTIATSGSTGKTVHCCAVGIDDNTLFVGHKNSGITIFDITNNWLGGELNSGWYTVVEGKRHSFAADPTGYINSLFLPLVVVTPTADPVSGAVDFYTLVSLSCATPGATIRFTINGSEPTEVSPIYTSPIPILYPMTIKAKGFKDGMDDSETGSFTYTLLYTPMSIGGGFYASKKKNNYLVQSDLLLRLVDITERLKAVDEHKNLIGHLEMVTFNDLSFERLGYTPLFYLDIEEDNYVG